MSRDPNLENESADFPTIVRFGNAKITHPECAQSKTAGLITDTAAGN